MEAAARVLASDPAACAEALAAAADFLSPAENGALEAGGDRFPLSGDAIHRTISFGGDDSPREIWVARSSPESGRKK